MEHAMDRLFKNARAIPSIPQVLHHLLHTLNNDECSLDEIIHPLQQDPLLTAKVLQMANSARYGLQRVIGGLEDAILLVGLDAVRTLAITSALISHMRHIDGLQMQGFWRLSLLSALLARDMAQDCGLSSEPAYLGALFHRIGWLAIHATIPTQSITINQIARDMTLTERADLEMRHLGFTHAHVGAKILSQWQLPETISDAIKSYLTPLEANASRLAGVVHCAVSLATQLENNIRPWHWGESVDSELSERLGLNWFAWQKKEKVIQQQRETADIITC